LLNVTGLAEDKTSAIMRKKERGGEMLNFKKEYRPISGQKWWEKILDVITREYPLNQIFLIVSLCAVLGCFAVLFLFDVIKPELSRQVKLIILWSPVGLVFLGYLLWAIEWIGDRMERSVKQRVSGKIEQYITENGSCSYDELICAVMKIRIHRGFDKALMEFVSERKFAMYDDIYRVPTREDKSRWRDEDVEIYGVSFGELEQVFAHPIEWFGEGLRIEFSVWEDEVHRLEKERNAQTGVELYICTVAGGERSAFSSFDELADAPLFDGRSLREVCDRICVSYANDYSWPPEFFEDNCTH